MTPEEVLNQLYKDRLELWNKATRKYAMGIGEPYPLELEKIDEQIKKIESLVSPLDRYPHLSGGGLEPQPNMTREDIEFQERQSANFLMSQIYQKLVMGEKNKKNLESDRESAQSKEEKSSNRQIESLYLVTLELEPKDVIFLVLNECYNIPIRCYVKNNVGKPTYIKSLYDIAYCSNVPNKKVVYNKGLADRINNGLFKKRAVKKFMKTNKIGKKPTLVQKAKRTGGDILVLRNDIEVKTVLIKNTPSQFQSQYIDKTK